MVVGLACCATYILAACGTSGPQPSGSPDTPSTTAVPMRVTVEPAPHQPSRAGITVKYDPCFTVPDSVPETLGFAVETRERNDYVFEDYAFIGCEFDRLEKARFSDRMSRVGGLTVWSSGITLDEFRAKEFKDSQDIVVGGRPAISYSSTTAGACHIAMSGPDGVIQVNLSDSPQTTWRACDHILEAAAAVEATLPDK
ncbi:DUF3558 domain-containing protein [Nocardia sp. AG03]|uniref:DUF3558 domain-containing protein n=1 Tax=Nocardia sp. AG03 TaxID=3025312 RepID=UPI0024184C7C|nr:DUF3558 domain-containing protein [Nocardia sp. AG03]